MDDNIHLIHASNRSIATNGESIIPIKNHFILKRESARTQVTLDIYEIPLGALSNYFQKTEDTFFSSTLRTLLVGLSV